MLAVGMAAAMTSCSPEEPDVTPVNAGTLNSEPMPENSKIVSLTASLPKDLRTRSEEDFSTFRNGELVNYMYVYYGVYVGNRTYFTGITTVNKGLTDFSINVAVPCDKSIKDENMKLVILASFANQCGASQYLIDHDKRRFVINNAGPSEYHGLKGTSYEMGKYGDCFYYYGNIPHTGSIDIKLKRPVKQYVLMSDEPIDHPNVLMTHNFSSSMAFLSPDNPNMAYFPNAYGFEDDTLYFRHASINDIKVDLEMPHCEFGNSNEVYYTTEFNGKKYAYLGVFYAFAYQKGGMTTVDPELGVANMNKIRIVLGDNENGVTKRHVIDIPDDHCKANTRMIIYNDPNSNEGFFSHNVTANASLLIDYENQDDHYIHK